MPEAGSGLRVRNSLGLKSVNCNWIALLTVDRPISFRPFWREFRFWSRGTPLASSGLGVAICTCTPPQQRHFKSACGRTGELIAGDARGLDMTVEVKDMKHLEKVIKSIRDVSGVIDVERVYSRG